MKNTQSKESFLFAYTMSIFACVVRWILNPSVSGKNLKNEYFSSLNINFVTNASFVTELIFCSKICQSLRFTQLGYYVPWFWPTEGRGMQLMSCFS